MRGSRRRGGKNRGSFRSHGRRLDKNNITKKDASYLHQFGESHPLEDEGSEFVPEKKQKFGAYGGSATESYSARQSQEDDDSSSEEEETTPYHELLSMFSKGKKSVREVAILSSSEEESNEDDDESSNSDEEVQHKQEKNSISAQTSLKSHDLSSSSDENSEDIGGEENSEIDDNEKNHDEEEGIDADNDSSFSEDEVEENDDKEEAAELDPDLENEEDHDKLDQFLIHFESELSESLKAAVNSKSKNITEFEFPSSGKVKYVSYGDKKEKMKTSNMVNPNIGQLGSNSRPVLDTGDVHMLPPFGTDSYDLDSLGIKKQIQSRIFNANKTVLNNTKNCKEALTPLQLELLFVAANYVDLYYTHRSIENSEAVRFAYCLHAANHILKTRNRIVHHNAKLLNKVDVPESHRDQGFVRPKVLMLVPFKDSALRIVKMLTELLLDKDSGTVSNKKRFSEDYGGTTLFMPKTNPKPPDYEAIFGGNVEDNFKIGLALTKKSVKLYTEFYSSDIIIASPLGLRVIIGAEGEKDRDYDFLSSIEVLIIDQAEVIFMQNWDHLLHVMRHLNLQPVTTHGTDFSRLRPWVLDTLGKYYRQNLIFSGITVAEINALVSKYCSNFAGQVTVSNPPLFGDVRLVTSQLPQIFHRIDCLKYDDSEDTRFKYFVSNVLPNFKDKLMSHTLIFVSSYFDFVRLRNYFKREQIGFVQICEYTKDPKIARARDMFFNHQSDFLLYTERAHFFRRFRLKGIGHLIFYQLPANPHFYSEMCNLVREENQSRKVRQRKNSSVTVLYDKYDALRLAPIVGMQRANVMQNSEKKIHAFVTES